jgi:hypothetical protein
MLADLLLKLWDDLYDALARCGRDGLAFVELQKTTEQPIELQPMCAKWSAKR